MKPATPMRSSTRATVREFAIQVVVVVLWAAVALQAERSLAAHADAPSPLSRLDVATVATPTMNPSAPTPEQP